MSVAGGIDPVVNDGHVTGLVHQRAVNVLGAENVSEGKPIMGSDDMCYFLKERPGCYYQIGCALPDTEMMPHHHPGFDLDERSLAVALRLSLRAVLDAARA